MSSISSDLPDFSLLARPLTQLAGELTGVSELISQFSPDGLTELLEAGQQLEIPDGAALLGETQDKLGQILAMVPSGTEDVVDGLGDGMRALGLELIALGVVLQTLETPVPDFDVTTPENHVVDPDVTASMAELAEITGRIESLLDSLDRSSLDIIARLTGMVTELDGKIEKLQPARLAKEAQGRLVEPVKAIDAVAEGVGSVRENLDLFLVDLGTKLSALPVEKSKEEVASLLEATLSVLDAPRVHEVVDRLDTLTFDTLGFEPVFDRVVAETEAVTEKVAGLDISQLNDLLIETLRPVLQTLEAVDFPAEVSKPLRARLETVIKSSSDAVEPLLAPYRRLCETIDRFDPAALVGEALSPPFETLSQVLAEADPAARLEPLGQVSTSLREQIQTIEPAVLAAANFHSQCVERLESLSPDHLLAPLEAAWREILDLHGGTQAARQILVDLPRSQGIELAERLEKVEARILRFAPGLLTEQDKEAYAAILERLRRASPTALLGSDEEASGLAKIFAQLDEKVLEIYPETKIREASESFKMHFKAKLGEIHPQTALVEPLDETYQAILELIGAFDIADLIESVTGHFERLSRELDEGLERSEGAFRGLLAAMPLWEAS